MRYFLGFVLALIVFQPFLLWSKHAAVELSLAQADWNDKTKELQFDLELRAIDKPFYLSFSDIVVAMPKSMLNMSELRFDPVPGTSQLVNLGNDLILIGGLRTKMKAGADTVYFTIQLMPNQFTDMGDFFEESVFVNTTPGKNRVARFSIIGVLQKPVFLKPHFAAKGPSSLILAFDPNNNFRAVELLEKGQTTFLAAELLNSFEIDKGRDNEVIVQWKWRNPKQSWQLWVNSGDSSWVLMKEGKGGDGFSLPMNGPVNAVSGVAKLYRLTFTSEKGLERAIYRYCIMQY